VSLRGFVAQFVVEVDQQLVIPLHEIHFDPLDAPFLELIGGGDKLIVKGFPDDPQNDAYVFLTGIRGQFLHIEFRDHIENVAELGDCYNPSSRRDFRKSAPMKLLEDSQVPHIRRPKRQLLA
jgi:hypothetical protein